ncbi:bifunctional tRNA (5-methylaminomethyl-2-thiouridine)(34)-methyltransferase MnmD/FAD-dependent 5-carboxymethylaminomethyl-2-thiouridine(34) oxidoreductase MnmC [Leptospira adleri]|uniref:tRNA 5-methylaminomethyl-2-thiouridine biosynthesis bifunctional protein MnmC n=1 Tax=Leptospira adleri TaxID=2023186 RepID=A0A2M9YQY1_9LEPT|nr:bifunctional tRNA (5-methylaminomethyl-2-thiouridine)(34)-methyltransferase MnmD/FAD-dependent 5-carboxymethylaminomethyl-2-thiouridine(34) oxidoreductase MnmC [Leptospira adleri]PJZ53954.1 bifunctional tRNA (5-methylaminomethyl-2-thiouridine)(34)-methyltransferase MnmD/FAD-dependent 5-carboxymethylaminomethyl-2-thiouridine(34) oxidoreductase MnmC [Leptospira adleri]PJZ62042.1 bifunctional tRNA (5-methylaminomethyl-2-thiouridine)(34)-methyltransferase MnmD/FAD-dependent 5-carboxymethylaminomet
MLSWKENLTPVSEQFGDIYFSPENGLEETKHVFIEGNDLIRRWEDPNLQKSFSILELGFGTGLNFLTTWKEYSKHADRFRLHYVSIEKFPLNKEEISKALSVFPELNSIREEFLNSYQDLIPGMNYFKFLNGKIHLTLFIGDAADALSEISGKMDAIFLDGFAPSKNPDMWEQSILIRLKRVCKPGTTFATFTVARMVRDSLTSCGFSLEKRPGFGRKREMLAGTYPQNKEKAEEFIPKEKPWCRRPDSEPETKTATIIGAGIAGSSLAYSLSKRGVRVVLIDPSGIANEASGIPGAISHPHITKNPTPTSLFTLRAFRYALHFLSFFADKKEFRASGLFHGITAEMSSERFRKGLENHGLSEMIATWKESAPNSENKTELEKETGDGIFFPKGFWTHPNSISKRMVDSSSIEFVRRKAVSVQPDGSRWKTVLSDSNEEIHSDSIIFCNSHRIEDLLRSYLGEEFLPVKKVRGQLLVLGENENSSRFSSILCAEHYLTPSIEGKHVLGSTFDEFDLDPETRKKDTKELLEYVQNKYPSIKWNEESVLSEIVGFRAQTPDRFPVIGPVVSPREFTKIYKGIDLPRNRNKTYPALKTIPGLFVFGALGSRGIISSFLGAEILASLILDEPAPVESSLMESLHPVRFLYRKIRSLD